MFFGKKSERGKVPPRVAPSLGSDVRVSQTTDSSQARSEQKHHTSVSSNKNPNQERPAISQTATDVIDRLCAGALGKQAQDIKHDLPSDAKDIEVYILSAFFPFIALGLAEKGHVVMQAYTNESALCLDIIKGGSADLLKLRFSAYSVAYAEDVSAGQIALTPRLLTRALENILGVADHTTIKARMALIAHLQASVHVDVEFLRRVRL